MEIDISASAPFDIRHEGWGRTLLDRMQRLRLNMVLCDTTIVTDDGATFRAHSNILAACSPVLQSSFPSDGNQEFLVPLHGVPSSIMALLLEFLYTGCIACDGESLIQLMLYADQLEIPGVSEAVANHQQDQAVKPEVQEAGIQVAHTGSHAVLSGPDDTSFNIECLQEQTEALPAVTYTTGEAGDNGQLQEESREKDIKQEPDTDFHDDVSIASDFNHATDFPVGKDSPPSSTLLTPRRSTRSTKKSQLLTEYEQQRQKRPSTTNSASLENATKSDNKQDAEKNQEQNTKSKKASVTSKQVEIKEVVVAEEELPEKSKVESFAGTPQTRKRGRKKKIEENAGVAIITKQEPDQEVSADHDSDAADIQTPSLASDTVNKSSSSTQVQVETSGSKKGSSPLPKTSKRYRLKGTRLSRQWKRFIGKEDEDDEKDGERKPKPKRMKTAKTPAKKKEPKVKTEKETFPCSTCGKTFRYASGLAIHEMRHQQIRPWPCDLCEKAFVTKSDFTIHRRTHTGEKPYVCQFCGMKFGDPSAWRGHERKHKATTNWECTMCTENYDTKRLLVKHQKSQHGKVENLLKCLVCEKAFMKEFELKIHERVHRLGLKCNICGKIFARRSGLEVHQRLHSGEKPFKCQFCGSAYASGVSLRVHERKHTEGCQFQCQYCSRKFFRKWELDIHERTHTGVRPYACDYCNLTFKGLSHLRVHERRHTGDKPYQCTSCSASFTNSSSLTRHAFTHTAERPHTCQECGKMFRRAGHLKAHQRTHVGLEQLSLEAARAHILLTGVVEEGEAIEGVVQEEGSAQEVEGMSVVSNVQDVQEINMEELRMEDITVEEVEDSDAPIYIQILNMP